MYDYNYTRERTYTSLIGVQSLKSLSESEHDWVGITITRRCRGHETEEGWNLMTQEIK